MGEPSVTAVEQAILRCAREVALLDDDELSLDSVLLEVPTMDSLAIVELLDQVEAATGLTLAPELIRPDTLRTPRALATALMLAETSDPT